ncbi:hypothetical protein M440DRAFT_1397250 [Trichoderma longibrachiatum ATCC 18648]|uniref:Zn(2)-C6 fungal-type domain-containing protein n=1 Tax=Trichoderma longibrachiatum ATCC 18648 TaxID=983965 RepID=A0A2T4CEJ6_TRILO|nr:hypothetical protein M440DRAFT_1397250 [Trichoderma longibrachiatum ATCC 18648]
MAPVRGRAACDGCRSRKQKCDEKRPTCSRCRDMKRECVWPKLYKRGPAKGYIEALEHRLAVTEAVLLQLLQVSDDSLLQDAFRHEPAKRADVLSTAAMATTTTTDAAGRIEAKKTGTIAHWDSFPLTTADEVKRWAGEVLGRCADTLQPRENTPEDPDQTAFETYPVPPAPLSRSRPEKRSRSRSSVEAYQPLPMEPTATALPTAMEPASASDAAFSRDLATGQVFDLSQDFRRQYVW